MLDIIGLIADGVQRLGDQVELDVPKVREVVDNLCRAVYVEGLEAMEEDCPEVARDRGVIGCWRRLVGVWSVVISLPRQWRLWEDQASAVPGVSHGSSLCSTSMMQAQHQTASMAGPGDRAQSSLVTRLAFSVIFVWRVEAHSTKALWQAHTPASPGFIGVLHLGRCKP
jgi:hypothetical protein